MSDTNAKRQNESDHQNGGRKKAKNWHGQGRNNQAIPIGARGILVTCENSRERRSCDEVTALVEEACDLLKPAAQQTVGTEQGSTGAASKDISALIAAEVADLKDRSKHRFKFHDTGVKGTFFLRFPDGEESPGPVEVVQHIMQQVQQTKQNRAPHTQRLLPVTHTCHARLEDIKQLADQVVPPHFPSDAPPTEFSVEYEHRNSNDLVRKDVIDAFAKLVACPPHKVNLNHPKISILVQLSRNVCAVSVVDNYRQLRKFNMRTLMEDEEEAKAQKPVAKGPQQKDVTPAAAAAGTDDSTPAAAGTGDVTAAEQSTAAGSIAPASTDGGAPVTAGTADAA